MNNDNHLPLETQVFLMLLNHCNSPKQISPEGIRELTDKAWEITIKHGGYLMHLHALQEAGKLPDTDNNNKGVINEESNDLHDRFVRKLRRICKSLTQDTWYMEYRGVEANLPIIPGSERDTAMYAITYDKEEDRIYYTNEHIPTQTISLDPQYHFTPLQMNTIAQLAKHSPIIDDDPFKGWSFD